MNNLYQQRIFLLLFIFLISYGSGNAQVLHKSSTRKVEKGLFGHSAIKRKQPKVREPKVVLKAKKKQEAKEKKLKDDYFDSVKKSQKRTIAIQTPEVQARMKQNKKDINEREKTKKRKLYSSTKKAGRKYK